MSEIPTSRISQTLPEEWRVNYTELFMTPSAGGDRFYGRGINTGSKRPIKGAGSIIVQAVRENYGFEPVKLEVEPLEGYRGGTWEKQYQRAPELWDERIRSGRKMTELYEAKAVEANDANVISDLEQKNLELTQQAQTLEQQLRRERAEHQAEIRNLEGQLKTATDEIAGFGQKMEDMRKDLEAKIVDLQQQLDEAALTPKEKLQKQQTSLTQAVNEVITPAALNAIREDYKAKLRRWLVDNGLTRPEGEAGEAARISAVRDYLGLLSGEERQKLPNDVEQRLTRYLEIHDDIQTLDNLPPPSDPPVLLNWRQRIMRRWPWRRAETEEVTVEEARTTFHHDNLTRVLAGLALITSVVVLGLELSDNDSSPGLNKEVAVQNWKLDHDTQQINIMQNKLRKVGIQLADIRKEDAAIKKVLDNSVTGLYATYKSVHRYGNHILHQSKSGRLENKAAFKNISKALRRYFTTSDPK